MGLWSRLRSAVGSGRAPRVHPDDRYGTGLWRQHRDRFNRAVDRFYVTAVALREEADIRCARDASSAEDDPTGAAGTARRQQTAVADAAEMIAQQTIILNALAERFDALAARAHAEHPVAGLVIPAATRSQLADLPELMSKAAAKVAEACQAGAMARAAVRTGADPTHPSSAARAYVADAADLVARCERLTEQKRERPTVQSPEPENG
jgi:hypothetical protein